MNRAAAITLYQPLLHSVAYRILGSVSDAEDIVQDTFAKWLTIDADKIRNTRAYLVRAVTNNCLNHLDKLERSKNELIEQIPHFIHEKWDAHIDLENELQHALQVIYHKLEPVERAVFVMREIFNYEYEEIQGIIKKKQENCRQLFHRARKKLERDSASDVNKQEMGPGILQAFRSACQHGNINELIRALKGESK